MLRFIRLAANLDLGPSETLVEIAALREWPPLIEKYFNRSPVRYPTKNDKAFVQITPDFAFPKGVVNAAAQHQAKAKYGESNEKR